KTRGFPVLATNVFGPPEVHFVDPKGSGLSTECGATDISDLEAKVLHILNDLFGVDEHVLVRDRRARGVRQARDNLVAAGDDVGTATVQDVSWTKVERKGSDSSHVIPPKKSKG